ncbi:hypothetical protein Cgig2_012917 [Carnegiea gigantea]|uniref:Uncharacterized protein n=1 Tax=Carnegiea gigantea TaxID=171969 RepID=A0A9Q1JT70_9CARY|nr:hypothetical protein Cgig2_012917 [Carnegiea gigantea]
MVINDAARLRLIRREIGESVMSNLRNLRWDVIEAWLFGDVPEGFCRSLSVKAAIRNSLASRPLLMVGWWRASLERINVGNPERFSMRCLFLNWTLPHGPVVQRMAKTKSSPHIRSPDELLAEGTQDNPYSAPYSFKPGAEVASTSTGSTSGEASSSFSSNSSLRSSS